MTNDEFANNPVIKSLLECFSREIEILGSMPSSKTAYEYEILNEIRLGMELWGSTVFDQQNIDAIAMLSVKEIMDATCNLYIYEDGADRWLCSDFSSRDMLKEWISYVLGETCSQ